MRTLRDLNQTMEGEELPDGAYATSFATCSSRHPAFEVRLASLPNRIFSGRERPSGVAKGVFFCWALPGRKGEPDPEAEEPDNWTEEDGRVSWYFWISTVGTLPKLRRKSPRWSEAHRTLHAC